MALLDIPPWLNVQPSFFTSALEAGARTGIALSEQAQRAQQLAEARAERQAQQAQRAQEFQDTQLLNMQKLSQDYADLQERNRHQTALEAGQTAQESRLLGYNLGQLGIQQQQADTARQRADTELEKLGLGSEYVPGEESGAPAHFYNQRTGGVTIVPASLSGAQHELGEYIPVNDPVSNEQLGFVTTTGPNTGHFTPLKKEGLTLGQQIQVQNSRARILTAQIRDSLTAPFTNNAARADYVKVRRDALEDVTKKLDQLTGGTAAPTVLAPTNAVPTVAATKAAPTIAPATPMRGPMTNAVQVPHRPLIAPGTFEPSLAGVTPGSIAPTVLSPSAPISAGPVRVRTKAERDALPRGTRYIGPDGRVAVKQ
jgi:hypothetical protein